MRRPRGCDSVIHLGESRFCNWGLSNVKNRGFSPNVICRPPTFTFLQILLELHSQELLQWGYRYPRCRLLFALLPTGTRKGDGGKWHTATKTVLGFCTVFVFFCFCLQPKLISRSPSFIKRLVLPIFFGQRIKAYNRDIRNPHGVIPEDPQISMDIVAHFFRF